MKLLIVLSGPIASGKSSLCDEARRRLDAKIVRTRKLLEAYVGPSVSRSDLQAKGDELDEKGGEWVYRALRDELDKGDRDVVVLDSVRKKIQLEALRSSVPADVVFRHIHLQAPAFVRRQRYVERQHRTFDETSFEDASSNPTEAGTVTLADGADVVIRTEKSDAAGVFAQAFAGLDVVPGKPSATVDVVIGAQYGSEGKGNICGQIAEDYDVLIRVGGPNAGHLVASPRYKYVQLPSGTQGNEDARIIIGAGATLWLPQLLKEIEDCKLDREPGRKRLSIDPQAMIIEQRDREMEEQSLEVIGSTKQGVGVATARKILGRGTGTDYGAPVRLARDVPELKEYVRCTKRELEKAYVSEKRILLEGTQGTDLSLHHGPYPFVTSRDATVSGCLADAGIAPKRVRRVIMVTRTYPIRVGGTSGPMMKEIDAQTIAARSGVPVDAIQKTEVGTVSGKSRRIGEFDWDQLRRAAILNGATDIALTFVDYLDSRNAEAKSYDQLTSDTKEFIERVARVANARVTYISVGFGEDKPLIRDVPNS
ncbi:adenylosuccinate synthase [Methylobacterium sp. Leaf86]|uniref:adenylosuccinate synthetase n=1 Tax=Methylobacterium sp. Leaf86 TaxID=1736242 RepID=UPI0006F2872B|nr:adenylosuccinate synthetase [Methylobacterium sp. Leaf86]KQO49402.1 adenylosuccinate synthase [Methylobacterium sp. Leaf86]